MTIEELRIKLKEHNKSIERDHVIADNLLLEYINDEIVSRLFYDLDIWYS